MRKQTPKTRAARSGSWLDDCAMNLLIDYYTEVQFRPYGSGATRKNVVPWLKQLELGYVCIYAKGHSGCTSFKSALHTHHLMLSRDMCEAFRDYTREAGTRLVLYYSGLMDGIAGDRHPDWRQWTIEGKPVENNYAQYNFTSYAICPLSGYWDEWVSTHLREMITRYDPDGIWVDGDWPGPCYCPRCQARFRADSGWSESWSDAIKRPDFNTEYWRSWQRIIGAWRARFRNGVKALKADCAYSSGNVSPRREYAAPFDWRSGDFFSPDYYCLHPMAGMMRWYATLDVPYDAYVCDTSFTKTMNRTHVRSRSKTLDRMLQEAATVAATGGQVGYWTYPLGDGALVPSRMRKAVAVRQFVKEREHLLVHSRSAHWNAIIITDPANAAMLWGPNAGAHKALAALHRSPDVTDESALAGPLPYDLIVVPEQALDAQAVKRLEAFVRKGGKLLTSGAALQSEALRKLLGVKDVRFGGLKEGHVLLKGSDEPTGIDGGWDVVALQAADGDEAPRELYPLYLSWDQFNFEAGKLSGNWPMHGQLNEEHPEPAGCPAAITRQLGKGRIVHLCVGVFGTYGYFGDPQMLRWLREVVDFLQPEPLVATNAPSWVDLSLRRAADGRLLAHFVNQNPGRDVAKLGSDDTWVDEIPEVGLFSCELRLAKKPQAVTWEPGGEKLEWTWKKGLLQVTLPRFRIHGCLAVSE